MDEIGVRQRKARAVFKLHLDLPDLTVVHAYVDCCGLEWVEGQIPPEDSAVCVDKFILRVDKGVPVLPAQPFHVGQKIARRLQRIRLKPKQPRNVVVLDGDRVGCLDHAPQIDLGDLRGNAVYCVVDVVGQVDVPPER
jgi:hypothetical protein